MVVVIVDDVVDDVIVDDVVDEDVVCIRIIAAQVVTSSNSLHCRSFRLVTCSSHPSLT